MPQIRIFEEQETNKKDLLKSLGFRWCKKDCRWEKNFRRVPTDLYEELKEQHPELTLDLSE